MLSSPDEGWNGTEHDENNLSKEKNQLLKPAPLLNLTLEEINCQIIKKT
ncbi:Uncharacterised protein [Enterococcus casseliflavus]|jgi:hypothetical protein|nr:Uncharacterised protein [Enterococcus casseliflavus]